MSIESIQNLDYVILLCRDVETMKRFYKDVLGLQLMEDRDDWVKFRIGNGYLTLRPRGRWYDGDIEGEGASVQLSFRVTPEDVNSAHQQLIERSIEILEQPTDQAFGHRTLYFKDPERNILEIYAEI